MKPLLLASALLVAMPTISRAETEFEGSLCFSSVTAECQAEGWDAGTCFGIRYAPRSIGTNGIDTELSLFGRTFAVGFKLNSGKPVAATPYVVTLAKVARGGYTYPLGFRFISQTPVTPTLTTQTISFTGEFTTWDEITNCTVDFRGAATLR